MNDHPECDRLAEVGKLTQPTGEFPAAAAELIRAAVAEARADGTLAPADGFLVWVRSEDDPISTSIDFRVGGRPDAWRWSVLSPECRAFEQAVRAALTGIACRYFTPDNERRFVTVSFDYNRLDHLADLLHHRLPDAA